MKILLLTQYFPPETGAPQNRLFEMAVRFQQKGAEISVLTAMPNYPQMQVYEGYKRKIYVYEEMNDLKVYRSWIYASKNKSVVSRLLNYFSFVKSSFWIGWFKLGKFDYVICESPPLFLGISAYLLSKLKGARLIFNVSDLWPESAEKLGLVKNKLMLNSATKLEEFLYRKSHLISGQTQGIVKNIATRFPTKKVYWLPNGADLNYYKENTNDVNTWREENSFLNDDFILLYAGVIGYAQGLEVILKAADRLKEHPEIKFVLVGSGPEKEYLENLKKTLNVTNVIFIDTVAKKEMVRIIAAANAAVIPLKKLELFKGAIPSKIFENLAMKKPILLGVEGEAKELFIDEGKCGLSYTPEDEADLANKVLQLYTEKEQTYKLGENGYNYVKQKFNRSEIIDGFWNAINYQS